MSGAPKRQRSSRPAASGTPSTACCKTYQVLDARPWRWRSTLRGSGDSRAGKHAVMTRIAACGGVQHGPVVPHQQHIGPPFVAVLEFLARLPLVELDQQRGRLGFRHALDPDDVAEA